ncbi:MAG: beta-L-arabinofuranosidase domain-containing protein [Planctomycetota bacterium]
MPYLRTALFAACPLLAALPTIPARTNPVQPLAPEVGLIAVPFEKVHIADEFWSPRIETNRRVTVEANLAQCAETGRLRNFAVAGGLVEGRHEGRLYNDSDVYKVLEGVAYTLSHLRDPKLEARADEIIAWIAAAQQEDGYVNTYYTLVEPEKRWQNTAHGHELYCLGHMIEAGIAYWQATGKRALLDVSIRMADHVDAVFGPGKKLDPPGHQELELALFKLARATGEARYRALGEFFLRMRGNPDRKERYGPYSQDAVPVLQQREVTGHAVRAMYQYCAMTDVARATGAPEWREALEALWEDVVLRKMYVTGGIGNSAHNEGFTAPFELPNDTAYAETCAAIGMGLWNHRLFLLTREARYADVLERELYNNVLSGVSLTGDRFFYDNPLASRGDHHRVPWFDCSCCPTNVVRTLPAVGERIYAHDGRREVYVVLYVGSTTTIELDGVPVRIAQETEYPWDGTVRIAVDPARAIDLALHLRLPGWAEGRYAVEGALAEAVALPPRDPRFGGWLRIERTWHPGDAGVLTLAMPPRRVHADPRVAADLGRAAVQRGPVVYALEGIDNAGHTASLVLPPEAPLEVVRDPSVLGGVPLVRAEGRRIVEGDGGAREAVPAVLTAVPYHLWDNRAPGDMAVWIPESDALAQLPGESTVARAGGRLVRASHCWQADTLEALCDGRDPRSSADESIPRHTFWDHRGTKEWLRYEWETRMRISRAAVYWFDDRGKGGCRVPAAWRLLWNDGEEWRAVEVLEGGYGTARDARNEVRFAPVRTSALLLEVELAPGASAGVLEWEVDAAE